MNQRLRFASLVVLIGVTAASFADDRVPLSSELRTKCLDVLRRGLQSIDDKPENFWPAMHAAEALTLAGQGDEVVSLLKPRLPKEADHQRRCGLARELVRAGHREPLTVLFATLIDASSNGRVHAAESLYKVAQIGDGRGMREALAQTENPRLQLMAAAALGRAGNPTALQRLRESLNHDDRELRKVGAWVLGLIGGERDVEPLQKLLAAETDELARAYYVNALACLGSAEARTVLGKNLGSRDAAVRTYSAEFAGYSRALEFRPQLEKLLDDENVDVGVRSAQSLIAFSLPRTALGLPLSAKN